MPDEKRVIFWCDTCRVGGTPLSVSEIPDGEDGQGKVCADCPICKNFMIPFEEVSTVEATN